MGWSLFFMFASAAICLLLPAAAAVILALKRKGSILMFFLGAASFAASQLLLRIPLLGELQNTVWFNMFAVTQPLLCALLVALSAGVFEETGRYAALKFINKDLLTWENGIMFGLGHGGIEAFWVGLKYIEPIHEVIGGNGAVLMGVPPYYFLLGGVERILAIAMHIGFTMIVLYAVKRRKILFYIIAVLAHGLVDATIPFMQGFPGWAIEGVLALIAALAVILTIKIKPAFNTGVPEKS
ncbi:MAG: YhfC family intramembrane metalloprotease [Burkholderiales bacterium]